MKTVVTEDAQIYRTNHGEVRRRFHYDENTGLLRWRVVNEPCHMKPGDIAGQKGYQYYRGHKTPSGIRVNLDNVRYLAHHVVWLWWYGEYPTRGLCMDHIDGNPFNNRITNLRMVTPRQNNENQERVRRKGPVRFLGVYKHSSKPGYEARMRVPGVKKKYKSRYGRYFYLAVRYRMEMEQEYGYRTRANWETPIIKSLDNS